MEEEKKWIVGGGDCPASASFGSLTVSPWSSTPYSDAVNRKRRRSPANEDDDGAKGPKGGPGAAAARIKRPMNAFMVWSQTERRRLSADNPGLHNVEISRRLGQKWLQMKEEERLPFMEEAERLRMLHLRQYPDYRYQPRKKTNSVVVKVEERGTPAEEEEEGKATQAAFQCTGRGWDEGSWKQAMGPLNDSIGGGGYMDCRWRQHEDSLWSTNSVNRSFSSDYFVSAYALQRQWPPGETLVPWPLPAGANTRASEAAFWQWHRSDLPSSVPLHPSFAGPSTDSPADCLPPSPPLPPLPPLVAQRRDSATDGPCCSPQPQPPQPPPSSSFAAGVDCLLETDPFISWLMNMYEVKELNSSQSN